MNKHTHVHGSAQPRPHASPKAHERASVAFTGAGACVYRYTSYKDVTKESVAVLGSPNVTSSIYLRVTIL